MASGNLLKELQRRNVIRMAGLYLVGAWLVTQVAATLLPVFEAPGWVMKALVGLLAVGFLVALVISWVFELTPDGLKRDGDVEVTQAIAPQTARRMDRMLLMVMALALGYFAVDKFVLASGRVAGMPAPVAAASKATTATATATATTPEVEVAAASALGIAVLPFDNLSPDPDNAFFAGGIHEEVLTRLSRINDLRVISRTSMENIAREHLPLPEIGRRLGVSHVLEGSVRRAGNQVRITAQLIEAASDKHIWAENYDRPLDDVFAIQTEIALAIAGQLEIALSPALQGVLAQRYTNNAQAYDLYLRAIAERRVQRYSDGFRAMVALLEPAIKLDPNFLQARVALVEAYGRMVWFRADLDGSFEVKAGLLLADIVRRWPGTSESRMAQAQFDYTVQEDYAAALAQFQVIEAERPNDVLVVSYVGASLKRLDRFAEQLVVARRAVLLDPEDQTAQAELVLALTSNGLADEAIALAEENLRRWPELSYSHFQAAETKLELRGERAPLLALNKIDLVGAPGPMLALVAVASFADGDIDGAVATLDNAGKTLSGWEANWLLAAQAELLLLAGRDAEARPLVRRAYAAARELMQDERAASEEFHIRRFAQAAWMAALADEPEAARALAAKATAGRGPAQESQRVGALALSRMHRWLGNPDAAWETLKPVAGHPVSLSNGRLRGLKPYYDALYGESAGYRAYMAALEAH